MSFWEYADSSGDDQDFDEQAQMAVARASSPAAGGASKYEPAVVVPDSDEEDVAADTKNAKKKPLLEIDFEDGELACLATKRRRTGSAAGSAVQPAEAEQAPAEAEPQGAEYVQMRAKLAQAFAEDDEEEEEAEVPVEPSPQKLSQQNSRRPSVVELEDDDDEDAARVAFQRAREAAIAGAQITGATAGLDTMILKVQCKHGSVQIRQGRDSNFEELLQKFTAHAQKQQWLRKGQRCVLQCDGDDVNPAQNRPSDFDLDEGEVIDVKIL